MKPRTKVFLKILAGAWILALVIQLAQHGSSAMGAPLILLFIGVTGWRLLVFLKVFFKPVQEKIEPYSTKLVNHTDKSLEASGIYNITDFNKNFSSIIGNLFSRKRE